MKNSTHSFTPAEQTTESLLQVVGELLSEDTQKLTTQRVQAALGTLKLGENSEAFLAQFQGSGDTLRSHLIDLRRALNGGESVQALSPSIEKSQSPESLNYSALALAFKKEKPIGKSAILWMADKGITPEWTEGNFKGARQALPGLSPKSRDQFARFYKEVSSKDMSDANNNSEYDPSFFMMDAHVAYALLGEEHFINTIQSKFETIHNEYQQADEEQRKTIIAREFGLTVNQAWDNLPGLRDSDGSPGYRYTLCALGAPNGSDAHRLGLNRHGSYLNWVNRDNARLCLLA